MSTNVRRLLEQPTVGFRIGGRRFQIDFGELLFPAIALAFSAAYYLDSRGLPEQSMMYAKWLLYATISLAVITLLRHAVSVRSGDDERRESLGDDDERREPLGDDPVDARDESMDGGVLEGGERSEDPEAGSAVEAETAAEAIDAEQEGMNRHFNLRTSVGLAVLTAGYMFLLNFVPFVVSSILFLAAALYMFGERNPIRLAGYPVGFSLLVWAVFIRWLLVPLP